MGRVAAVLTEGIELTAGLRALLRSGVVALVGVGAGAVFLILGVAAVALQSQCGDAAPGVSTCADPSGSVLAGSGEPDLSIEPELPIIAADAAPEPTAAPVATAASAELALPSTRDVALKAAGGLIAGTFEVLVDPDVTTDAAAVAAVEVAAAETGGEAAPEAVPALTKRTVTSVPVGSDGQPVWSAAGPERPITSAASLAAAEAANGPPDFTARRQAAGTDYRVEPLAFAAAPEAVAPAPRARPETRQASVATPADAAEAEAGPAAGSGSAVANGRVRVGGSAVNVRSGPSGDDARLFVLAAGSEVQATHAEKGWVRIIDNEDRAGWLYASYLVDPDVEGLPGADAVAVAAADPEPAAASDVRRVTGQGVNVRSSASGSAGRLFALPGGSEVTVTDNQRGWLRITDAQGRSGWVYSRYLTGG